jgi:AcrR family transcriptional regulator
MKTERVLLPRDERRETILRGAAHAFAVDGYTATSMEDVAAAAGITKLIVYRHFATKEELYRAVLQRVSDRLAEEFMAVLARTTGPAGPGGQPQSPGIGVRTLLNVAREDPEAFILLWRHASREKAFAAYASEQRERVLGVARTAMKDRIADPMIREWAARAVTDFVVEAVLDWLVTGDESRDEELVDLLSRAVPAVVAAFAS